MPVQSLLCALFVFSLFLSGCAVSTGGAIDWSELSEEHVWPEPPASARLKYLRSLRGGDDFKNEGTFADVLRWLSGAEQSGLTLVSPYGVAADGAGRVWVADAGHRVVFAFDLARQNVEYIGAAGRTFFRSPVGVAFDEEAGLLYVSDSALRRVFVLGREGAYLAERHVPDGFGRPGGLAVGPDGRLYVVDVLRDVVEVFSRQGSHLTTFGGEASAVRFSGPTNVAVGVDGRVHVTDSMNFRAVVLDAAGNVDFQFGSVGDVPGAFARPRGIAVDADGNIYVADAAFDNIQVFDSAGRLFMFLGGVGTGPGRFSLPAGLCFDSQGRLYVSDPYNKRVQVFQYLGGGSVDDNS